MAVRSGILCDLRHVLLILPGLIVIGVAVGYLRDGLMVQRERVHQLAEETIGVAQRIGRD